MLASNSPLPEVKCGGDLASSLRYLDLSGNRIAWLLEDFWSLENPGSLLITGNWSAVMSINPHASD